MVFGGSKRNIIKNSYIYRVYVLIKRSIHFILRTVDNNYYKKRLTNIGKHVCIYNNIYLSHPENIYLDDYTRIQSGFKQISNTGKIIIKKYSGIAQDCIFITNSHIPTVGVPQYLLAPLHINDIDQDIIVKEDVWIGARCIILPNCEIGRGAIIGAGSVVTHSIPPYAVAAGSPAKIISSKFTIEEILAHESKLYPVEERMSQEELINIFNRYFDNKKSIGTSFLSTQDEKRLNEEVDKLDMKVNLYNS